MCYLPILKMRNCWNLKLSSFVIACIVTGIPFFAHAQFSKPDVEFSTDEKYIYPIYPGKPGSLAGTMGELRNTHFHSGIDIRTDNKIGYPVLASKSGYISRVTTSPSGYGNIIYITHPDHHTTLYAHLDRFKGVLADYVLKEQYKRKSGTVDLHFQPHQFVVKQGDTIALAGNSGSSSGPHLHFDIRDPENYALDPLKVADFPEVPDNLPPAPEKIALKTLDRNSRINDRFGRFEFHARRLGDHYTMATPILASGLIGIEIVAKDRLAPGSPFYGGVNYIDVHVDSQLVFSQAIDKIDIAETRAIYTLMDFKAMRDRGTRFYKLYIDDGNNLKYYDNSPGSGKILVSPDKESLVQITMSDSYDNKSVVSFKLRPSPPVKEVSTLEAMKVPLLSEISENTLMITAQPCTDTTQQATMYSKGNGVDILPDYSNKNRAVYLIDLRHNTPDSIVVCGNTMRTNIKQAIPSGTEYKYYGHMFDVMFPAESLYDTVYLTADYTRLDNGSEIFSIGDRMVPLHKLIRVSLKPMGDYPQTAARGIYRLAGRSYTYLGRGAWGNGKVSFNTREFGEFTILQDSIPPGIRVIYADRRGTRFKINDDLSGIDSFEATLNGEFLLMHYDSKSATIWSEQLDKKVPLTGNFELVVTDRAGNRKTFTKKIL